MLKISSFQRCLSSLFVILILGSSATAFGASNIRHRVSKRQLKELRADPYKGYKDRVKEAERALEETEKLQLLAEYDLTEAEGRLKSLEIEQKMLRRLRKIADRGDFKERERSVESLMEHNERRLDVAEKQEGRAKLSAMHAELEREAKETQLRLIQAEIESARAEAVAMQVKGIELSKFREQVSDWHRRQSKADAKAAKAADKVQKADQDLQKAAKSLPSGDGAKETELFITQEENKRLLKELQAALSAARER